MTNETNAVETTEATPRATKKVTKKAVAKKVTKKAVKKGAKKAPKAKKEVKERADRGPSKLQQAVLKVLVKSGKGLTRTQISEKIKNSNGEPTFIGDSCLGHVDQSKIKERSLLGRGYVTIKIGEPRTLSDGSQSDTPGASIWKVTASGIKAQSAQ